MPQGPDALKHLAPNWFAIVMGLTGLALAWSRAAPILGDMAGAGALVLAGIAALAFVALAVLSWIRWQHYPEALAADLKHPVRHAFIATVPVSIILLATVAVSLLGTHAWIAALWWLGSLLQFGVTLWALVRWLNADKTQGLSWAALTPALLIPVVGNVLAPLAGVPLGAGAWSAAQFGLGVLLWPVLLTLLFARIAVQGLWAERLLPTTFITIAPRRRSARRVLPGFNLTLGYTLLYLSLIVLIPLSALVIHTLSMSWAEFWAAVSAPRVLASFRLSFGASLIAACVNVVAGLLVAWVLVRYPFPGKKFVDALVLSLIHI